MKAIKLRSFGSYDVDEASNETAIDCKDPSLAIQSQRDESDINVIVERFGVTGMLPQRTVAPLDVEFAEVFDFQSAMDAVVHAQRAFMNLPAKVRERLNNDPAKFVDFCNEVDENGKLVNIDELRKYGLANIPEIVVPSASLDDVVSAIKENGNGGREVGGQSGKAS